VSERSTEFLVLLGDERGVDGLASLKAPLRVTQVGSPRLAIVEGPYAAHTALRSMQDVAAVLGPGEALESQALTDQERLFADAWALRTSGPAGKERAGEGLAWDAPGLAPPDPPDPED
jgi:hypothetical protein